MGTFKIEGNNRLKGDVFPQGAKNEALQVLCTCLLTKEKVVIHNLPNIIDVNNLIDILKSLNIKVEKLKKGSYSFQADDISFDYFDTDEFKADASRIRGSVMIAGPILAHYGKVKIPKPGGDKIGRRRLDTHFENLIKLGATFSYDNKNQFYNLSCKKLKGKYLLLDEASVTGTANILMAAVLAEGITTIYNAACEPYIQQLCKILIKMGAQIKGVGSNLLTIEGVESLHGAEHHILPDMIEIGSWIGLAAMTKSEITIKNVSFDNLGIIPKYFDKLGIQIIKKNDDIFIPTHNEGYSIKNYIDGSILTISDAPWPGLTPDLLSVFLVVATQAKGNTLIHQKMFESRLFFVDKLIDMGANIILCDPHRAAVTGLNFTNPLRSAKLNSPDIRAGMALLIAALSAEGTSIIHNIEQIDRGYEDIDKRLISLGANIQRID